MTYTSGTVCSALLLGAMAGIGVGLCVGVNLCTTDDLYRVAASHKAGRFIADPLTGKVTFRWNDEPDTEP